ncbi:hypothetical protein [Burkholderia sp. Ax-1719]|uniref:hypothetical protein n=1 Tax=Burkholderia sp. Ax-1719 TaxID=2608334 RepID=UPI001420B944|nr:hypothetical protein [Burkholderia sp. Ax-1719]NIE63055.1 hypothetical protein [Burkholderia sp. Ax-1719]
MTSPKHSLPQDWPEHLNAMAQVNPSQFSPPINEPQLLFTSMAGQTFEQFCWWLLQKEQAIVGCKRIGDPGIEQGGIDLFAFDEAFPDKLRVFECKAWTNFDAEKLKRAVDTFLEGDWVAHTKRFTIILAHASTNKLKGQQWMKAAAKLRAVGIEPHFWTADDLTLKVQAYPDVLSKFFPGASVEHFGNKWMQRVAFYEVASKAFFDPRERVAQWAREICGPDGAVELSSCDVQSVLDDQGALRINPETRVSSISIDSSVRTVERFGSTWQFRGPWFGLSAILPGEKFMNGSAAINFKKPDLEGMTLTFDYKWLMKSFLFAKGAPLASAYRGFVYAPSYGRPHHYEVDFPHCRFSLHEDGVREIAGVADLLTDVVRDALLTQEHSWSAVDFPFVEWGGRKVAIATLDERVWNEVCQFAIAHDVTKGKSDWHMFQGATNVLKPFHEVETAHYDAGYHGIFYAVKLEGLSYGRKVALLWQPDGPLTTEKYSSRRWWSCEEAFDWFKTSLLPEVKRHVYARRFGSLSVRLFQAKEAKNFAADLDELFVANDVRISPLLRDGSWSAGIVDVARELSEHFNRIGTPEPFFTQQEVEDLYGAVAVVAEGGRGHVGYVSSSLSLAEAPESHEELARLIHEHIKEGRVVANRIVVDYAFRAMLELLADSDDWLSDKQKARILPCLVPFALARDDGKLVERHTRWS